MVTEMKWLLPALICICLASGADTPPRTVYLLPMARGLDQYLANQLTSHGTLRVVTDAKQADVVFTDRLGEAFEERLNELRPVPEAPKPAEAAPEKDQAAIDQDTASKAALFGETVNKLSDPSRLSSFGRARGTVFLVDARSGQVIWSTFEQAKDSRAKEMDRTARHIVERLSKSLAGPAEPAKK